MTDTLKNYNVTIDTESHSDRIPAPAKRWRVHMKVVAFCFDRTRNRYLDPDEVIISRKTYPSSEIAEQVFLDCMAKNTDEFATCFQYLGAFPE